MRFAFLALLAVSACSSPPEASGDGALLGTVQSVDLTPMTYDGDAVITMETDAGETVLVNVPARMNLCEATGLALVGELLPGDRIEVMGERREDGSVTPCAQPEHRLARAATASGGPDGDVWDGYFFSSFETSSFRVCDGDGLGWWLTPNTEFNDRYVTLQAEAGPQTGRRNGPHVRVQFEGERSAEGRHGHLGAYPYEIRVTRLLGMEVVADGDGEWPDPTC